MTGNKDRVRDRNENKIGKEMEKKAFDTYPPILCNRVSLQSIHLVYLGIQVVFHLIASRIEVSVSSELVGEETR